MTKKFTKRDKAKKKMNFKAASSILLGLLMVGGVLAVPNLNSSSSLTSLQSSIRAIEKDPEKVLQPVDLGIKPEFQLIEDEFNGETITQEKYSSVKEGREWDTTESEK